MPRYLHPRRQRGRTRSPNNTTQPNRFHTIPTELVLLILDFLPTPDLYTFAFTCSSLHHVALSVYLERYKCELVWASPVSGDVLKALGSAVYRPKLRKLVYVHCLDGGRLGSLPYETRRRGRGPTVQKVLHAVDVDEVQVRLADAYTTGSGNRAEDHLARASSPIGEIREDWEDNASARLVRAVQSSGDAWVALLDAVLVQAKCRSLTVEMVTYGLSSASLDAVEDGILRQYYGFKHAQSVMRNAMEISRRWLGASQPVHLETFHVHSEALFHPRLVSWTISTLTLSPSLASVSFDHMHRFRPSTWELLLPCITIPHLKQLSINLHTLPTEVLYAFLARHCKIEELRLGKSLPSPDAHAPPSLPSPKRRPWRLRKQLLEVNDEFLPSLRTLIASPGSIVAFLSSPFHPFATLEKVVVEYRAKRLGKFTVNGVNHDLAPVCLRLRNVKDVVLQVESEGCVVDWVQGGGSVGVVLGSGAAASSSNHPHARVRGGDEGDEDGVNACHGMSFVSSCVTTVEFKANVYVLPQAIVVALPKWLAAFSKLRTFSLRTLASQSSSPFDSSSFRISSSGHSYSEAGGWRMKRNGEPVMDIDALPFQVGMYTSLFLDSLSRSCPSVKRVEVDGREVEFPTKRVAKLR